MIFSLQLPFNDYTKVWLEHRDRGGLYYVNDKFYDLVLALEKICRKYLDLRTAHVDDLCSSIARDCLRSLHVSKLWSELI